MKILSVDPGTSTGYCVWSDETPLQLWAFGQLDPRQFTWAMHDFMPGVDEVVIEGITIGPKTGIAAKDLVDTLDVLGWVKLEARRLGKPVTVQRVSDAKAFVTDQKLKNLGWWDLWQARSNRDVRSAARHLLKYLVDRGLLTGATGM